MPDQHRPRVVIYCLAQLGCIFLQTGDRPGQNRIVVPRHLAITFPGARARKSPSQCRAPCEVSDTCARVVSAAIAPRPCAAVIWASSERQTSAALEFALHFWNSCQHDHRLPGPIFRSCSDLIADQIDGHAVAVIGRCKMQLYPVNDDSSIPHPEKTAEIDHGGSYLPPLINQDIDNPAQV